MSNIRSALLKGLIESDHDSWLAFHERYEPLLLCCCHKHGIVANNAEDVVQTTMANLLKRLDQYDKTQSRFTTWIWMICVGEIHHWRRTQQRKPSHAVGGTDVLEQLERIPNEEHDSEDDIDREALQQAIDLAMRNKSDQDRAIFNSLLCGETPSEIANRLGCSVNTVYLAKSRSSAAIKDEYNRLVAGE